jgi:SNF2 family DNA or RNA helicase
MSTLHGSWIVKPANSYFFLWGETWRNLEADSSGFLHPFNLTLQELQAFLQSQQLDSDSFSQDKWQIETIDLPSKKIARKKEIIPFLSEQFTNDIQDKKSIVLQDWQVEGFRLNALETIQLLQVLPLGNLQDGNSYLGDDLRFWTHIYRWSLDLLARGKFLPGISRQESGQFKGQWYPLLDSSSDRARFAKFLQLMPAVCEAYNVESQNHEEQAISLKAQELLLGFLREILDAQVRPWLASISIPKEPLIQPWLKGLTQVWADFTASEKEAKRIETALYNWTLPVQDSLATPTNQKLGQDRDRVCFSLQPPINDGNGEQIWQLQYYLQALDNPEFLIDAQTIWQNPIDRLIFNGRTIEQPQETFLKGLGLASRIYPVIEESLQQEQPKQCELNSIQVYEFIKAIAWQLQDSGLGVKLPPGLASGTEERRLGIQLKAEVNPKKGERLNLKSLLNYELKIAVGDRAISKQEFERLLAQKSPLVEVDGEWIALQPADVRAAKAVLEQSNEPINLSVEDALRLSSGETKVLAKLPIVSFETSGALKELIDNFTNNQAIEPIEKPAGFKGELRPYQARGVGWLAFLEKWGLGACLADDMGLGKCLAPESLIYVNGLLQSAQEIWEKYTQEKEIEFDGEGFWSIPTTKLLVNSIDEKNNKIVQAPIQRLYRQQVREKLRKITLQDGSNITITQQHKLLTNNGWTNKFQVGDYICTPAKMLWTGKSEDKEQLENTRDRLQSFLDREVFYCQIKKIEDLDYEGWVYDFEVSEHHNFIANNIICHNTIQTLAFLLNLRQQEALQKPVLLICPTSVLNNWEREVRKFSPTLSTLIHHGDKRSKGKTFANEVKKKDLVITSYPLVYRDATSFEQIEWQGVVLDEAQNIKNPQAKQSQAVRKLKTEFRIALTGTPVENRLSELWSILDFLNPGFLGAQQFFQRRFAIPIEKYGDRESLKILRSLVRPFILRRLKTDKDIIQDLPEKQEMNVFCGLSVEQAQIYQQLVEESLAQIEESTGIQRRGLILTLLVKLKQICNHPAHFLKEDRINSSDRSGKLLRLEEMLEELLEEGDSLRERYADRALIFTQFSEWGKLLQAYLEKKFRREILFLYGGTRSQQRQEMIDRFQNDPNGPRIFILSLKAGGTGLNLTRANHVFHIDRWWNPAVENQATDRAFRIGQKQNVQVHKFVCTGTLEERINDTIESKKQLAELTVDSGEQWLTELDTEQLRNLLLLERNAVIEEEDT